MPQNTLELNKIWHGNCIEVMQNLPEKSIDLIFADPPYNLQLQNDLIRPNQTLVDAVDDEWDQFDSFSDYDSFTEAWLREARRIMKDTAAIWVIGSYHNIFRVGKIMMDLGFWVLNDVHWHKSNPMPNFRGTRFTNATETMIWAKKTEKQKKYTFNYQSMKNLNDEKQMQNVWHIPLCRGSERIMINGQKAHSTQKPEALLYRVILASSNVGDVVLDPFFGSGTTGAVAKKLKRSFVGIEREAKYVEVATQRINSIPELLSEDKYLETPSKRKKARVSFASLIESGYLDVGQSLFSKKREYEALLNADSHLSINGFRGSIHKTAAHIQEVSASNGWDYWYIETDDGELVSIDELRNRYRTESQLV